MVASGTQTANTRAPKAGIGAVIMGNKMGKIWRKPDEFDITLWAIIFWSILITLCVLLSKG